MGARAALCAKPMAIPDEVKAFMQIAADEEDEDGKVNENPEEEEEEQFGIAKNLLAEKSEIKLLKQNKLKIDAKRNEAHRQLIHNEDDKQLELMKRAFIDGDYRQLQSKHNHKNSKYDAILDGDDKQASALDFRSRKAGAEEKNEYCCYDRDGQWNNIHKIRMKINDWNRMHNVLAIQADDDEEDPDTVKRRKKRVKRKEVIQRYDTMDAIGTHKDKINKKDKSAHKILEQLRNKSRKKPKILKSQTLDGRSNFASLQSKSQKSSSFLSHRDKCIERLKDGEANTGLTTSVSSKPNKNRFLFQRVSANNNGNKKRKRDTGG